MRNVSLPESHGSAAHRRQGDCQRPLIGIDESCALCYNGIGEIDLQEVNALDVRKEERNVTFTLGGMVFEYDEEKNQINIKKHGIPFTAAARVFFDYDRIELFDDAHSEDENRYNTIGDTSAGDVGYLKEHRAIGGFNQSIGMVHDILFVVYTERIVVDSDGHETEITRLISARMATSFERGLYYGKQ